MASRRWILTTGGALLVGPALAQAPHRSIAPPRGQHPRMGGGAPRRGYEPPPGAPASSPLGTVDTAAKQVYAIDFNTGAVLLDKEGTGPMTPSSMTKLMTAYIVYSSLKSGKLKLDQEFPVSQRAYKMGGSRMFVQIGTMVKVEDLIRGMIVQSGNDACVVLAEGIAGSEEGFADLMNKRAQELELEASTFRNSTGWPHPEHRMSARDIVELARRIILDFPEFYKYDSEKTFKYNNIDQPNRNTLVQKGLADGLKTGHTDEGGYGMVVSAERNGRRTIVVVNGLTTMHQRADEAERLLEWTFREFENVTLFSAGATVEQAPVWLGQSPTVPLVGGRDLTVTLPRGWRTKAKIAVKFEGPVPAPITRGMVVGALTVSGVGVPDLSMPLMAGADVPRLGLPGRAMAVVTRMVTGS